MKRDHRHGTRRRARVVDETARHDADCRHGRGGIAAHCDTPYARRRKIRPRRCAAGRQAAGAAMSLTIDVHESDVVDARPRRIATARAGIPVRAEAEDQPRPVRIRGEEVHGIGKAVHPRLLTHRLAVGTAAVQHDDELDTRRGFPRDCADEPRERAAR